MTRPLPAPGERTSFRFYPLRKLRLVLAWLFFLVLAVFAKSTGAGFLAGIPLILSGEAVRIWAHGYLRKTRRLAVSGPYAYVRNPLYLGNFLIGLGFCAVIWNPLVAALFVGGFALLYWVTVKGEEERLLYKFEGAFAEYARNVPRFIPRLSPYAGARNGSFAFHRTWGHGELITILAILTLLFGIYLRQVLYQERQAVTGGTLALAAAESVLFIWMVSLLLMRKSKRRFSAVKSLLRQWRNWQTRKT
jgi:protein-S-isoprenylcysteine O-methyltransferase Ste14